MSSVPTCDDRSGEKERMRQWKLRWPPLRWWRRPDDCPPHRWKGKSLVCPAGAYSRWKNSPACARLRPANNHPFSLSQKRCRSLMGSFCLPVVDLPPEAFGGSGFANSCARAACTPTHAMRSSKLSTLSSCKFIRSRETFLLGLTHYRRCTPFSPAKRLRPCCRIRNAVLPGIVIPFPRRYLEN